MFSSVEYTNPQVSSFNEYTSLDSYYDGSQFGPKPSPKTPSMQFPVIQNTRLPWKKYDALTHDTDGNNYYNIGAAYGPSCQPSYYVAKCPSNKFIRPFAGHMMPTPKPLPHDSAISALKNLRVIFFYDGSGRCPHSMKAMDTFKNELKGIGLEDVFVSLKDINNANNKTLLKNIGGTATPFFFSQVTQKSVMGAVPGLMKLVEHLTHTKEGYEDKQGMTKDDIRDLGIVMFMLKGCGFCDKLKQDMHNAGLGDVVEFMDAQEHGHSLKGVQGFPYTMSKKTGKAVTGHPGSVSKLIHSLS